jgi:hypothetical protein
VPEEREQKYNSFDVSIWVLFGLVIFLFIAVINVREKSEVLEIRMNQLSEKIAYYEGMTEPKVSRGVLSIRGVDYIAIGK